MNVNYEIPDELHKRLKVRAAEEGMTLKDLIIHLLAVSFEDGVPLGEIQNLLEEEVAS